MVMSRLSVHLTTLFAWASLTEQLTSTCIDFRMESYDCLKVGISILVGAFHIIMGSFCLKMDAFRIIMGAFHIVMGSFRIIMDAFRIIMGAFHIIMGSFRIIMDAFRIIMGAFHIIMGSFRIIMDAFQILMGAFHIIMVSFKRIMGAFPRTRTVGLRQRAPPNALQRKDIRFGENLDNHSSDKTHIQT